MNILLACAVFAISNAMDQSGKWEVVGKPKKSKPAMGDSKQKSTHDGNLALSSLIVH